MQISRYGNRKTEQTVADVHHGVRDVWRPAEILGLDREFSRKQKGPWRVREDALEPRSFRRRLAKWRSRSPLSISGAMPDLLASNLFFHRTTWLLAPGRRGPDAGFFCAHIKGQLASESRSGSGAIPFPAA